MNIPIRFRCGRLNQENLDASALAHFRLRCDKKLLYLPGCNRLGKMSTNTWKELKKLQADIAKERAMLHRFHLRVESLRGATEGGKADLHLRQRRPAAHKRRPTSD